MTSDRRPAATHASPIDAQPARGLFVVSCLLMGAGVALGAFGAHGLRTRVAPDLLAIYETGVRYHLIHGLAAVLAAMLAGDGSRWAYRAGWLFLAGILLFAGSLYVLALTNVRWLGAVTPLGGLAWIVAWCLLAAAAPVRR